MLSITTCTLIILMNVVGIKLIHPESIIDSKYNRHYVHIHQHSICRQNELTCKNGKCIDIAEKCDGIVDCTDGSDETFEACHTRTCEKYLFHCDYGACIDMDLKCDGIQNCVDNSDEKYCNTPTHSNMKCG